MDSQNIEQQEVAVLEKQKNGKRSEYNSSKI